MDLQLHVHSSIVYFQVNRYPILKCIISMTSFEKLSTPLLRGLCCSICIEACQLEHFYQLEAIDKLTCQKMRDTPRKPHRSHSSSQCSHRREKLFPILTHTQFSRKSRIASVEMASTAALRNACNRSVEGSHVSWAFLSMILVSTWKMHHWIGFSQNRNPCS